MTRSAPAIGSHVWANDDDSEYEVIEYSDRNELTIHPVTVLEQSEENLTFTFSARTFWLKYRDQK